MNVFHLCKQLYHGVLFPQQLVDLLISVHCRVKVLAGAGKIFGHVADFLFLFFKSLPLSDLLNINIY